METYYGKIKERLIEGVKITHSAAKEKDINKNRTYYGACIAWMKVLQDMGHEVKVAAIEERGFVKFLSISIDGKFHSLKKQPGQKP